MAIELPVYPRPLEIRFQRSDYGVVQRPPFGGKMRRYDRPGAKHVATFEMPAMDAVCAARFIGLRDLALASGEPLRMRILQPQFDNSGGGYVAGAGQAGRFLNVHGVTAPKLKSNLLTYSGSLSNAAWTKVEATVLVDPVVSPDGAYGVEKIAETAFNGEHYATQTVAPNPGIGTYSAAIDLAAHERTAARIVLYDGALGAYLNVNLATGAMAIVAGAPTALKSEHLGVIGGLNWWRFSFSWTSTAAPLTLSVYPMTGGTTSYPGVAGNGLYARRPQINLGSTLAPYVPTAGAAAWAMFEGGRAFNLDVGGEKYLYLVGEDTAVSSAGAASIPMTTILRSTPTDDSFVEFDRPVIDGWPTGDDWTVERLTNSATFPLSIEEA